MEFTHTVIFYKIRSHAKFAQNWKFFRETNLLIALIVKHVLGNSNFDQFGANLRKNDFSKSKTQGIREFKSVETSAQDCTERKLFTLQVGQNQPLTPQKWQV